VATSRSIPASDEPDLFTVQGDITHAETSRRVAEQALERVGRIDTLINNAGVYIGRPFTDYTSDDYAAITAVNLAGFGRGRPLPGTYGSAGVSKAVLIGLIPPRCEILMGGLLPTGRLTTTGGAGAMRGVNDELH
jgi:NAD(P)-dependent dehydrogenase (short-subunit alcohol dehydrogenase family)